MNNFQKKDSDMENTHLMGNKELLSLPKTAFLCSRKAPASVVLKCYDWAVAQREAGNCVISGFHSQLEKDVFHFLMKGSQPIIIALARGMKKKPDPEWIEPLENGRLLIVTPFDIANTRVSSATASRRNQFMIEMADEMVVGFVGAGGNLEKLLNQTNKRWILL